MPMHLIAYQYDTLHAGTDAKLTPVADPTVTINGNLIYVPDKYNQVLRAYQFSASGNAGSNARLETPSLREIFYPSFGNEQVTPTAGQVLARLAMEDNPIQLVTNEGLEFHTTEPSGDAAAVQEYGLVLLSDGARQAQKGKIFRIRGTCTIQQTVSTWADGSITFDQTLPVGTYDIVGMQIAGTGLIAGRLVFIGPSAVTRPGVPATVTEVQNRTEDFYEGRMGLFGTFNSVTPPSLEVIGGTATAQTIYLDLIKRS